MKENVESRITRLEERQAGLEKAQSRMWKRLESMDGHLLAIQKTLNKLFYIGIGISLMYLIQTIGFTEMLKKAIL